MCIWYHLNNQKLVARGPAVHHPPTTKTQSMENFLDVPKFLLKTLKIVFHCSTPPNNFSAPTLFDYPILFSLLPCMIHAWYWNIAKVAHKSQSMCERPILISYIDDPLEILSCSTTIMLLFEHCEEYWSAIHPLHGSMPISYLRDCLFIYFLVLWVSSCILFHLLLYFLVLRT
jgi:hypothetical protein